MEEVSQEMALSHHLQYNHYPPIDLAFIPVAKRAIELANADHWKWELELPRGMAMTKLDVPDPIGQKRTVYYIIEALHLDSFLDGEDMEKLYDVRLMEGR